VYLSRTFAGPWQIFECPFLLWQRVTDPNAANEGARKFLPNPINRLDLPSLSGIERAEICIEAWGGHAGTSQKVIRFNGGEWMGIAEPDVAGPEVPEAYQYFRYPVLEIDPGLLREGENTFELSAGPQRYHDFGWGQWGIYGVTVRLYPSRPARSLAATASADIVNSHLQLRAELQGNPRRVDRVDFVGFYEDFDHHGEGMFRDWHYTLRYGHRRHTLGTTLGEPHVTLVDTSWIPTQSSESRVIAVVTDYDGNSCVSEPVKIEWPQGNEVRMFKPMNVPPSWQTRAGNRHSCEFAVDLDPAGLSGARITFASWNGLGCDAVELNGTVIAQRVGRDHDFDITELDVPIELLRRGRNQFSTYSETEHHGIEVLLPGPVLKTMSRNTRRRKGV
jgi:hypothetical protein